ncbi:hypothetical protein EVAR_78866_1 [Eumeta japonica]|uniref:Uncharacterized protein n=1 Tax=Eumeta variegata TaxID=151549 RepID=A0A4C1U2I4_EUMVA|nr:hypothetical protein EVAR_78866_1 [Eumeta japonica]
MVTASAYSIICLRRHREFLPSARVYQLEYLSLFHDTQEPSGIRKLDPLAHKVKAFEWKVEGPHKSKQSRGPWMHRTFAFG